MPLLRAVNIEYYIVDRQKENLFCLVQDQYSIQYVHVSTDLKSELDVCFIDHDVS